MTDEEKDEYFMIKTLKKLWNKEKTCFKLFVK